MHTVLWSVPRNLLVSLALPSISHDEIVIYRKNIGLEGLVWSGVFCIPGGFRTYPLRDRFTYYFAQTNNADAKWGEV